MTLIKGSKEVIQSSSVCKDTDNNLDRMAWQRRQESSLGLGKMPSYSLTDCLPFYAQKNVNTKAFSLNEACRHFQTH